MSVLGSKSRLEGTDAQRPLFSQQRALITATVTSGLCQKRTQALQHDRHKKKGRLAAAFPKLNLVGTGQQTNCPIIET
jgi:hypothetical protein